MYININDHDAFFEWGNMILRKKTMTLKDRIKASILTAVKAKDDVAKNILKVVLGEIDTQEGRGKDLTDEQIYTIVRKTLQGIEEMLTYKPGNAVLLGEKAILTALVPTQLSREDIIAELTPKLEELKGAKADGQATGIAMKHFKANKRDVDGTLVAEIVKQLRTT
jgi:hypothetical protein